MHLLYLKIKKLPKILKIKIIKRQLYYYKLEQLIFQAFKT